MTSGPALYDQSSDLAPKGYKISRSEDSATTVVVLSLDK